jgi:carboxyl-terminal processing protease
LSFSALPPISPTAIFGEAFSRGNNRRLMKVLALLLGFSFLASAQTDNNTCELIGKVKQLILREHFNPKPIDDSLSAYVFDTFVDAIDEDHILFTKAEYDSLRAHRLTLDNAILREDCSFLGDFISQYRYALERKRNAILSLKDQPMDYTGKDSIRFSKDAFPFDLEASKIPNVWRKRMAFDILEDISKQSNNLDSLKTHFADMEKAAAARVFESSLCRVNSELESRNGLELQLLNDFLNAFCTYFDPHTNYFFLDEKMSFMSSLSTSNLSLGLEFAVNEKSEIVIMDITPGGPAAQSKQFEKDDLIVKVSDISGRQYLVSCTPLETIGDIIFSDANRNILLTIKKKNGAMLDVKLKKEVMKAAENSAYSYIADDGKSRVGYLKIPSFYSDFDTFSNHGCAEDAEREIEKLKKENIDGLVIDLIDNGGGSMEEAVKLAGLFIDSGPIAVAVDRYRHQDILRDYIPGIAYSGPIVVLINGASASASEFFAAAMQDYNRAVIAGATSLGKATIQVILPVDERQQEFVKTTIEKFYRITGQSAQIKGITPDVYLPVIYDEIIPREKSEKTAMPSDQNPQASFKKIDNNFSGVISDSNNRVKSDARFNGIAAIDKQITDLYNNPLASLPIRLDEVFVLMKKVDGLWKQIKEEAEKTTGVKISNAGKQSRRARKNTVSAEINEHKMKQAACNVYLQEATRIIGDIKNNPAKTYYKLGKTEE